MTDVRLSEVLAGLSHALDLTEGQRQGHAARTCLIGMRLADELGLSDRDRSELFYALLMKDLGCSSNAARFAAIFAADDRSLKAKIDRTWRTLAVFVRGKDSARQVARMRCERGANIARLLSLGDGTVQGIRALDEHWDGRGLPHGLSGQNIPLLGRLVGLAQTVEVFAATYGIDTAYDVVGRRRGTWFEPALVDALRAIPAGSDFWRALLHDDPLPQLARVEPGDTVLLVEDGLDRVAEAFGQVIDAKSPWTYRHSSAVADLTVAMGDVLGLPRPELRTLRRVALLHDLGKLGVSNLILDKPGRLTDVELAAIKLHPEYTRQVLARVGCFRAVADLAASHHERLDGTGYDRGAGARDLGLHARILCAADICDALRTSRPYRPGLPAERVLDVMRRDVGAGVDPDCFAALKMVLSAAHPAHDVQAPAVCLVPELSEDYHQAA
jgi:HD-GYP domain-containing protein (c-di-GMP phosphodiesterase class II)